MKRKKASRTKKKPMTYLSLMYCDVLTRDIANNGKYQMGGILILVKKKCRQKQLRLIIKDELIPKL